jgi:dihydrofolate synthase
MIDLGLARISALLKHTPQAWKAVHVAGTNGKGTICAYLTAMLRAKHISCGRFTSPHLIDRWDCITINDCAVSETKFRHFEDRVRRRNTDQRIGATEFELLTATAFEIFESERVEFGVVEVGLGGRLDATNVLKDKTVTVVSKIGLDHQSLLGNTIEEIALQKAGIIRKGVPCVVDGSNTEPVLAVIRGHAEEVGAPVTVTNAEESVLVKQLHNELEPHQRYNLACAAEAFQLICKAPMASDVALVPALKTMAWPGRLQALSIEKLNGRKQKILLDGAHNPQSAKALSEYVEKHLRTEHQMVTWVLAASAGKDVTEILRLLLRPGDSVAGVEFGPVDGMPWVNPTNTAVILAGASACGVSASLQYHAHQDVRAALEWAAKVSQEGPLVAAGSLYLVSDVLRLLRASGS